MKTKPQEARMTISVRHRMRACAAALLLSSSLLSAQIPDHHTRWLSGSYAAACENAKANITRLYRADATEAVRRWPSAAEADRALLGEAAAHVRLGEDAEARVAIQRLLKNYPTSPLAAHAYDLRAATWLAEGNYANAEADWNAAAETAAVDYARRGDSLYYTLAGESVFNKGVCALLQGKRDEALESFLACAADWPNTPHADDAMLFAGMIAEDANRTDEAITRFQSAHSQWQKKNTALAAIFRQAQNYLVLRRPVAALEVLAKAQTILSALDANDTLWEKQSYVEGTEPTYHYLTAEALSQHGKYAEAEGAYGKVLARTAESHLTTRATFGLGYVLLQQNKNQQALDRFDAVIANGGDDAPSLASARLYRPLALRALGRKEEAEKELRTLSLQPDFPFVGIAHLELGQMYYETGRTTEARKILERGENLSSDPLIRIRMLMLLGSSYLELDMHNNAVKSFDKALGIAEKSSDRYVPERTRYMREARMKKGIAAIGAGQSNMAIALLTQFLGEVPPQDERLYEVTFWLAEAYYKAEMMQSAEETYQRVIRLRPRGERTEEALYGLGWTQFRNRQFTPAATTFGRLLREYPSSRFAVDVLTRKGDGHYLSKQFAAAADAYRQASRRDPRSELGQYSAYQLGQALLRDRQFEAAAKEFRSFVGTYPSSALSDNALYAAAWAQFQMKNWSATVTEMRDLLERYPRTQLAPRAWFAIGDAHYNSGEYQAALEAYSAVKDQYPNSDLALDAVNSIQYCLVNLGRADESSLAVQEFLRKNPTSPAAEELQYRQGELFINGRKYKDAVAEFEQFLRNYPESDKAPEALYWLAKSYMGMSQAEANPDYLRQAESVFLKILRQYADSEWAPVSSLELGTLHILRNDPSSAERQFEETRSQFPDSEVAVQASFELAYVREKRGDTAGAAAAYLDLAERYKGSEYGDRSRFRLGVWHMRGERIDSAIAEFSQLLHRDDELGAEAQYRIGELLMRRQEWERAIAAFTASKDKYPEFEDWFSLALLNLGECYEKTQKIDLAKEMYRLVQALRPTGDDIHSSAKSRLERLNKR